MLKLKQNKSEASTTQDFTPEEIATMKKIINFAKSVLDSLNTGAISNLASTVGTLGILLEDVNTPEMRKMITEVSNKSEDLTTIISKVSTMQKDGTLDSLLELATFIGAVKKSMSSDIILKMTSLIPDPKTIGTIEKVIDTKNETKEIMKKNPPNIGVFSLLQILKDPDISYLLGYLVVFSRQFSKIVKE